MFGQLLKGKSKLSFVPYPNAERTDNAVIFSIKESSYIDEFSFPNNKKILVKKSNRAVCFPSFGESRLTKFKRRRKTFPLFWSDIEGEMGIILVRRHTSLPKTKLAVTKAPKDRPYRVFDLSVLEPEATAPTTPSSRVKNQTYLLFSPVSIAPTTKASVV